MVEYHPEGDEFGGGGGGAVDRGVLLSVGGDQGAGVCGE